MEKDTKRFHELLNLYLENKCNREEYEELIKLANQPGNEAHLKLFNEHEWAKEATMTNPGPEHRQKAGGLSKVWTIAASIALLCTLLAGLFIWWPQEQEVLFQTSNGQVKEIELPDGTKATLNANSTLTWHTPTSGAQDRLVTLTGEAFFEVPKIPIFSSDYKEYKGFKVITPKMTVHVLGTSFNVIARSQNSEVFLKEGSVELQLPHLKEKAERLEPGEKITMDHTTGSIQKHESENVSSSASWITGVLNYVDKPMGEVLQNISELFGVEIICLDQNLNAKKINLGVPYMDWESTKRALEIAINVEFRKDGNLYMVDQK